MKKILTYGLLVAITLFTACRKEDNPKIPDLARVPVPSLKKDPSGASVIIPSTISTFEGKVIVDMKFPDDVKPKKMDLVVIKNGNKANVKVLKADITTFPTVVTFTGPQLVALFGIVVTCDFFEVGVNVTAQDGKVYEAYPAVGSAYGAGVAGQYGGVTTTLVYSTKVEFDPSVYTGAFITVSDEFEDFLGYQPMLIPISPTQFSFISPAVTNPLPIIVTIDPVTLGATIANQKIGDAFTWNLTYTNPKASALANNPLNKVSPCEKTLTLILNYTVDQGSFGAYKLVLKKK